LLLSDNLSVQKKSEYTTALADVLCKCVYGPKNGTDVWQPVDHGVGQRYQDLNAQHYLEWTQTNESIGSNEQSKAPSAPRVRELMVNWTHETYEALEEERPANEDEGKPSLFELAFLRTGCLVSANNDDIDAEIQPGGVEAAIKKSRDSYYRDHKSPERPEGIQTFRELLLCSDGCNCEVLATPLFQVFQR
jgi:hypothetical protein